MKLKLIIIIFCIGFVGLTSCRKFLETKSNQSLATPETLADLEAILNNPLINKGTVLLNGMSDEYYYSFSNWNSRPQLHKEGHVWDAQLNDFTDWSVEYYAVFNANTVLYNLDLISKNNGDIDRQKRIRGAALVYRALTFYRLLQLYALQYDKNSASADWGIPLRLSADINEESSRAKMQESYDRILTDLQEALTLLPETTPESIVTKTFPTRAASFALLARVYLQMGEFTKAKDNASQALQLHGALMDFNDNNWVDAGLLVPFKPANPEVVLYSFTSSSPNSNNLAKIDSNLYKSYDNNDLRKKYYFIKNSDPSYRFRGSYSGKTGDLFCGLATDELYLIRAECLARANNFNDAMLDLNHLLKTRWRSENGTSTYVDQVAADADEALEKILSERKKELVYREVRWSDIKRLNKETKFAITLSRNMNGQTYTLLPNDLRFALLIPIEVMNIVKLPQNAR
jgi:starch-binding outer membrane protein, SusD/RagB family